MTFSIVGSCERTGMVGVAITTSSICVASRCPWVRAGVGAVATQNITDPSLGPQLLDQLANGVGPTSALASLMEQQAHADFRQVTAVDSAGNTAHFTGAHILGRHSVSEGRRCVAAGNLLATTVVTQAMTESFAQGHELHLAERLLQALQSGVAAGGEEGPTHSSGIKVANQHSWPLVDLRIDWSDGDPVAELVQLWHAYEGEMDAYTQRAINPADAPSYGVPGDP
ncbi:MAG: DUF1028 domain-containing protein [Gammaproteobacteria bacterium]|nr:DUF1028 domain-containing protein [Gammaproteobacteria bacterium]